MAKNPQQARDGLGSLIARAGRQWRRVVDRRLQPFGLTEATWLPLIHLARAPAPMRQKDLAASLVLDGSSVVRLLDALEAAQLIKRREGSEDRRAKTISLTPKGFSVIERVEAVSREVRHDALASLSGEEIEAAARVLDVICRNLTKMQEKDQ